MQSLRCGKKNGKEAIVDLLKSRSSTMSEGRGRIRQKGTLEDFVFHEAWHESKFGLSS